MDSLKLSVDLTGKVAIAVGALVVLAMIILSFRGSTEIKTFELSLRGQDASLALVRSDACSVSRGSSVLMTSGVVSKLQRPKCHMGYHYFPVGIDILRCTSHFYTKSWKPT